VEESEAEPVAIVGIGCRLPGGVDDLASLQRVLRSGRPVVGRVPPDRWDQLPAELSRSGADMSLCDVGAFLAGVDHFDAEFFGISPKEARGMDPQQRMVLEVAWEAMADAGARQSQWRGSRTGVFLGLLACDYTLLHAKTIGLAGIDPYYATGKEFSFAAGRVAYVFDLHGPVLTLSTACSSSLMAVHLACQSLRMGECDAALAGGVSLMLTPDLSVFMARLGALSPTGRCRPFDARADGVVRSEGCGVVVLKRLPDALADGDHIWAIVRASASNHDGHSAGLTVPSAPAQAALLRSALARGRLSADDVHYVEAHATGTPLGDPIELIAVSEVYGSGRGSDRPILVGSHKAIFGHMDAAAGIAGLLKAVVVVRDGLVPLQPSVDQPTPAIERKQRPCDRREQ